MGLIRDTKSATAPTTSSVVVPPPRVLVTATEASQATGAHVQSIRRWIRDGVLEGRDVIPPKTVRVDLADVEALVAAIPPTVRHMRN